MSATAWTALADRFAALAAESEFHLWLYPFSDHHLPDGTEEGSLRRICPDPLVPQRTGYPAAAVQGAVGWTSDEFLRFNRFTWLSWAAGRLASPGAERPDVEWLLTVFRECRDRADVSDRQAVIRNAVAASAEAARRFVGAAPARRDPPSPPPAGPWQFPFQTLRHAFFSGATGQPEFHIELRGHPRPNDWLFGRDFGRLDSLAHARAVSGRPINTHESGDVQLWGDSTAFPIFKDLAEQAGRALPSYLTPSVRLLPCGGGRFPLDDRPSPLLVWLEFLWLANPANYLPCYDSGDPGARKAVWRGGNPFMASTLAIDQFVLGYGPETVPHLSRRMVEVCPWFTPEDRAAVSAAVEAAFRGDPAPSVSAVGNTPAEPDAAYTLEDIRNLLRYKREYAAFTDRRRAVEKPVMSATEYVSHGQWLALNCPQPGRLTEERAATLLAYRRLMRDSVARYGRTLDEETFRLLVAEAAARTGTDVTVLMRMPFDEFERTAYRIESGGPCTLGRLLADRREEWVASHQIGREVEFDDTDHYGHDPAYRRLEAFLNARGQDVTPAALLQLRGEVCSARNCDTADADRLTLQEVADLLDCPGGNGTGSSIRHGRSPNSQRRPGSSRKPGRPSDTDHTLDRRTYEGWITGTYPSYADLARAFNLPNARAAKLAVQRHRKRLQRGTASQ